jgi:hypothetical protein
MTPAHSLATALAAALLDGPWEAEAMVARLSDAIGEQRPWMATLVRATRRRHRDPPRDAPDAFARWLETRRAFVDAIRERPLVRRWATPAPAMIAPRWDVPLIHTSGELASWLGADVGALDVLADRRGLSRSAADQRMRHYRYTWIAKRTGGHRLLEAPKWRLRDIQRRVLDGILARIPPHASAHGFRTGHSILDFVAPHVHRPIVVRVDLQAFFTSVFAGRVYGVFRAAGYPEEVARTLTALCTHRTPSDVLASGPASAELDSARLRAPHLPQGAPSSGALANLAAYRLDVRLAALANSVGARYSRYADDLVVSGERELIRSAPTLVARIGAIAIEEGFAVNFRKTRVMTAGAQQRVAGIVVNEKPSIARVEIDRLRAILHNCARNGPSSQNRDGHADFRAHLLGRIAWISQVDRAKGTRLRSLFDRIVWT